MKSCIVLNCSYRYQYTPNINQYFLPILTRNKLPIISLAFKSKSGLILINPGPNYHYKSKPRYKYQLPFFTEKNSSLYQLESKSFNPSDVKH